MPQGLAPQHLAHFQSLAGSLGTTSQRRLARRYSTGPQPRELRFGADDLAITPVPNDDVDATWIVQPLGTVDLA